MRLQRLSLIVAGHQRNGCPEHPQALQMSGPVMETASSKIGRIISSSRTIA